MSTLGTTLLGLIGIAMVAIQLKGFSTVSVVESKQSHSEVECDIGEVIRNGK